MIREYKNIKDPDREAVMMFNEFGIKKKAEYSKIAESFYGPVSKAQVGFQSGIRQCYWFGVWFCLASESGLKFWNIRIGILIIKIDLITFRIHLQVSYFCCSQLYFIINFQYCLLFKSEW